MASIAASSAHSGVGAVEVDERRANRLRQQLDGIHRRWPASSGRPTPLVGGKRLDVAGQRGGDVAERIELDLDIGGGNAPRPSVGNEDGLVEKRLIARDGLMERVSEQGERSTGHGDMVPSAVTVVAGYFGPGIDLRVVQGTHDSPEAAVERPEGDSGIGRRES